jgi:hypothetical protein
MDLQKSTGMAVNSHTKNIVTGADSKRHANPDRNYIDVANGLFQRCVVRMDFIKQNAGRRYLQQ